MSTLALRAGMSPEHADNRWVELDPGSAETLHVLSGRALWEVIGRPRTEIDLGHTTRANPTWARLSKGNACKPRAVPRAVRLPSGPIVGVTIDKAGPGRLNHGSSTTGSQMSMPELQAGMLNARRRCDPARGRGELPGVGSPAEAPSD